MSSNEELPLVYDGKDGDRELRAALELQRTVYPDVPEPLSRTRFLAYAGDFLDYVDRGVVNHEVEALVPTRKEGAIARSLFEAAQYLIFLSARKALTPQLQIFEIHKREENLADYVRRRRDEVNKQGDKLVPLWSETH